MRGTKCRRLLAFSEKRRSGMEMKGSPESVCAGEIEEKMLFGGGGRESLSARTSEAFLGVTNPYPSNSSSFGFAP